MAVDATGWLDGVGQARSQLYGGYEGLNEDAMYPQAIVLHVAQGTFSGLLNMARSLNARSSWQFSVGREGQRAQHVSIWDAAWHAGIVARPTERASRLIAQFGQNPNRWSVGIEMEGFSVDPGYSYDYEYGPSRPWPAQQIGAVIATIEQIRERCQWLKDLPAVQFVERIITHSDIDQMTRAQDPGDFFMATAWPVIRDHFLAREPVVVVDVDDSAENSTSSAVRIVGHAQEIIRLAQG